MASTPFSHTHLRAGITGKRAAVAVLLLCFLAGLSGCNTVERRIRQNPELFMSLNPEEQQKIREGRVSVGFTPEMVKLAWGSPDFRQVTISEEDETQVWTWISRRSVYSGRRFAGYQRDVYFDRRAQKHRSFMRPVYVDTYRTVESELGRIEFRDGKAAVITRAE